MRRMFSKKQIKEIIKKVIKDEMTENSANFHKVVTDELEVTNAHIENDTSIGGDLSVGGAITGKTLKQSEANKIVSLEDISIICTSGLEASWKYGRLEEINNILYFVILIKLNNPTESAIASSNNTEVNFTLPDEWADKIFDYSGIKLSEDGSANTCISCDPGFRTVGVNGSGVESGGICIFARRGTIAKNCQIFFRNGPSVPANNFVTIEARFFLTLI